MATAQLKNEKRNTDGEQSSPLCDAAAVPLCRQIIIQYQEKNVLIDRRKKHNSYVLPTTL